MSKSNELVIKGISNLGVVRGLKKKKIQELGVLEATKIIEELQGDSDALFEFYSQLLRMKEFISAFDVAFKPEMVKAAKDKDLWKRAVVGDIEFMLIKKEAVDYSLVGSKIYTSLLEDKAETAADIKNLEGKMKKMTEDTSEINGEKLTKPTRTETEVLNAYY
jgi:hypothetical protein